MWHEYTYMTYAHIWYVLALQQWGVHSGRGCGVPTPHPWDDLDRLPPYYMSTCVCDAYAHISQYVSMCDTYLHIYGRGGMAGGVWGGVWGGVGEGGWGIFNWSDNLNLFLFLHIVAVNSLEFTDFHNCIWRNKSADLFRCRNKSESVRGLILPRGRGERPCLAAPNTNSHVGTVELLARRWYYSIYIYIYIYRFRALSLKSSIKIHEQLKQKLLRWARV